MIAKQTVEQEYVDYSHYNPEELLVLAERPVNLTSGLAQNR
jgi:hypothetical protein